VFHHPPWPLTWQPVNHEHSHRGEIGCQGFGCSLTAAWLHGREDCLCSFHERIMPQDCSVLHECRILRPFSKQSIEFSVFLYAFHYPVISLGVDTVACLLQPDLINIMDYTVLGVIFLISSFSYPVAAPIFSAVTHVGV
jgi:hypothetical protein